MRAAAGLRHAATFIAHGFLRLRCGDCGHDKLVAFNCKRRGTDAAPAFVETLALTDDALPSVWHGCLLMRGLPAP